MEQVAIVSQTIYTSNFFNYQCIRIHSQENNGRSSANRPPQQPKTGGFVILLVITAVIGGLLFGYDTGIVSTAMLYISDAPDIGPLSNIYKELIVSLTPGMAGIGALIAGPTSDAFGRRKVIMSASFLFTIGAAICAGAFNVYILLLGRVILGIAIGRNYSQTLRDSYLLHFSLKTHSSRCV
jgi:MFS family permease